MKTGSLLSVAGSVICFAVPAFAQQKETVEQRISHQRDLLGNPKALGEFGVVGMKVDEAIQQERRQRRRRAFHGGRGFGGTGRNVLRSASHRKRFTKRRISALAYPKYRQDGRSGKCAVAVTTRRS
jgi:hypothetical protein